MLWSLDVSLGTSVLITMILNIGLCFIVVNTLQDEKTFFLMISGFVIGALVASSLLFLGFETYQSGSAAEMGRATLSEESNPVILARSIAISFLAALPVFFEQNKKMIKIFTVGLLVLFFMAMTIKTQSRGALACALGIPVLTLILCSKSKNRLKYLFLALVIGGISFYAVDFILESNLMSKMARERFQKTTLKTSGRLEMWRQGFNAFLSQPIQGYGINNSPLAMERGLKGVSIHNTFLALTVDLGLIGLALVMSILFILYKQIKIISDMRLKWLGIAMLLYASLSGMTSVNYPKKDFWYALTCTAAIVNIDRLKKQKKQVP
jgi:O-antigen ligase